MHNKQTKEYREKYTKIFEERIAQNLALKNIQILTPYLGRFKEIECYCPDHDCYYTTTPGALYDKKNCCPVEARKNVGKWNLLLEEEFDRVLKENNPNIVRIDPYKGNATKIKFHCNECGHDFMGWPQDVKLGQHCPVCKDGKSFNNRLLEVILSRANVEEWDVEYHPKWTMGKRYDGYFKLNKDNKEEKYVIEAQGIQHERDGFITNGVPKYPIEKTKENDKFKYDLAIKNGYKVIYISCSGRIHKRIFEEFKKELEPYFSFKNINMQECINIAKISSVSKVAKIYNDHPDWSTTRISEEMNRNMSTTIKLLHNANDCGLIVYPDPNRKSQRNNGRDKEVFMFNKDYILEKKFEQIRKCLEYIYKDDSRKSTIYDILSGKRTDEFFENFTFRFLENTITLPDGTIKPLPYEQVKAKYQSKAKNSNKKGGITKQ